ARCTKRPIAMRSSPVKSSISSMTKSEDIRRKHGKI
ncbi:hypothetical protein D041_0640B, partial [Vibrio parahaemolyticus EKP-008]